MGVLHLIIKLLDGFPAVQQFLRDVFKIAKQKHADKRKQAKDDFVDDLIADALRDDDGLRNDKLR